MLIVIEGIDCCGKTTQAKNLCETLGAELFAFPDDSTPAGKLIRRHLAAEWCAVKGYDDCDNEIDAMVFQSLQAMNRIEHLERLRKAEARKRCVLRLGHDGPHMYANKEISAECGLLGPYGIAVCARYWQSGYAYGAADGLDKEWLINIHKFLPQADVNILLDLDPREAPNRRAPTDRYEEMRLEFKDRVRANYLELWRRGMNGELYDGYGTYLVINAALPLGTVTSLVNSAIKSSR